MAGERYASITIQATLSHNDNQRGNQTNALHFTLGGQVITLRRGGSANEFAVPDPDEVGEDYARQAVQNMLNLLGPRIFGLGLPYTVSAARSTGTTVPDPNQEDATIPVIEFDITATSYDIHLTPDFSYEYSNSSGWAITQVVYNVSPVYAAATVTDAGIYGAANGRIDIMVTGGDAGFYFYAWSDGVLGNSRTGLRAGTYTCTVRDGSTGAYTTVVAEVKSDPQLVVEVTTTPNSITLRTTGGVAPYSYAWADGATTAGRLGLPTGTYLCTVTDAHGATQQVEVALAAGDRYWFSGNAITLSLDAGAVYRADPTTKPGLSFVCQVWVELDYLSDVFVQVGQDLEQPATADGRTTFEVQELLEPFVEPQLPAAGLATMQRVEGVFRRFYLRHYERTSAGDGGLTSVETNYLVHGGLDFREAAEGTWFTGYQATRRPFLSWEPSRKKVLPDQPEYLYFMVPVAYVASFRYRLRLHFVNGSSREEILATSAEARRCEIFCLPAGPAQLNLASYEATAGSLVARYVLDVLSDDGSALSEECTFVLDRRPVAVHRYFLYANSLGGWNTLVCRGRLARDMAIKTSASENARAAGYDPLRGDYSISRRTGLPTLHCYTGARSAEQLVADQDFLLSERVLLLEGGRYLAGQVKDRTVTVQDEFETRRVVQFDYELPRERYYTPRLA